VRFSAPNAVYKLRPYGAL